MMSLRKTIVWSVCLMLGLTLFMSSSGEVYCMANEGHVKIEPTHLQHCCVDDFTAHNAEPTQSDCHDECVECSDIPIDSPQWHQRSKPTEKHLFTSFALPVSSLCLNVNSIGSESSANLLFKTETGKTKPSRTISILLC